MYVCVGNVCVCVCVRERERGRERERERERKIIGKVVCHSITFKSIQPSRHPGRL